MAQISLPPTLTMSTHVAMHGQRAVAAQAADARSAPLIRRSL
jgi:hypothetical protein